MQRSKTATSFWRTQSTVQAKKLKLVLNLCSLNDNKRTLYYLMTRVKSTLKIAGAGYFKQPWLRRFS